MMERDPLTVLEEMGVSLHAGYDGEPIYLSVQSDGRYFCEDLDGDSLADLREAAARLLATVENPPPLPPPPEPVYPSSPIAYKTDKGWEIDVGYRTEGVFRFHGAMIEYQRDASGATVLRSKGPLAMPDVGVRWLDAGNSDWLG